MPNPEVAQQAAYVAGAVLLVAAVLVVAIRVIRARRRPPARPQPVLDVDLKQLGMTGPPARGAVLECCGVPVRLAVLVIAPQGRQELPGTIHELSGALDEVATGLSELIVPHGTLVRRWPAQLSPRGFVNTFFTHVRLPGDHGRGTPWCGVAGRIETADAGILVGLALCAASPNALSQIAIQRTREWHDTLRVVKRP
jgi:hypothetical protein